MKSFDIFISYSRDDKHWAQGLADALKRKGAQVWLDEEQVKSGAVWRSAISRALQRSHYVVTILDPKDARRPNTYFEAGMAIGLGKKVAFVMPQHFISSGNAPFDVKRAMVIRRRTPDLTAKELLHRVMHR